jgi:hypothetical protein
VTIAEAIEASRTARRGSLKRELRAILAAAAQTPMPQGDAARAGELCDALGVTSAAAGEFTQRLVEEKHLAAQVDRSDAPARLAKAEAELAELQREQREEELAVVKRLDDPSNQSRRRAEQSAIAERYSARIAEATGKVNSARQARDEFMRTAERLAALRRQIQNW